MKTPCRFLAAGLLAAAIAVPAGRAQISITNEALSYTENFNHGYTAGTTSTANPLTWTDNETIAGWSLYRTGGSSASAGSPATIEVKTQNSAGSSVSSAGNFYLISETSAAANFAFGARVSTSNSADGVFLVLSLVNNTGGTITDATLGYTALQWYYSDTAANPISVGYTVSSTGGYDLIGGTWTEIPDLAFTANNAVSPAPAKPSLNFNDAAFHTDYAATSLPELTWNAGDTLVIRWLLDYNGSGTQQGIGIDNVSFTVAAPVGAPIPEPATTAMIAGLVGLAGACVWRRLRLC